MINIISKSHNRLLASGPKKVVDNLIKGLDAIGYPYAINRRLDACQRLWIHDDLDALWQIKKLPTEIKVAIGPNLFVKPSQVPKGLDLSRAVYLQPSRWTADFWQKFGFNGCPVDVWPTGIDTTEFSPALGDKSFVLVYFKQRSAAELEFVKQELVSRGLHHKVVQYPKYRESEYKKMLAQARYMIWLGGQESQGLALLEGLSCNIPMLVCDVGRIGDSVVSKKNTGLFTGEESVFPATSAEYFDSRCGIKIKQLKELPSALDRMEKEWKAFNPREYILQSLSLEKQAKDFVEIYQKHFGLGFGEGFGEKLLNRGKWKNDIWRYKAVGWAKDCIKILQRAV